MNTILILGVLAFGQGTVQPHPGAPGPRAAISGIPGFQTVSKIDFGAQQNRLTAAYVFPDRARWHFEGYGAPGSEHLYIYRSGGSIHQLPSGQPSQDITGEARDVTLLQMELRRAAMLWPDGFEWNAVEGAMEAPVYVDTCCRSGRIGILVASAIEAGRPRSIEARDASGRVRESMEIGAWQELGGRSWPRTIRVRSGGEDAFVETVESVETRVYYLELSFLAPDRRPRSTSPSAEPAAQPRDLVPVTFMARALPQGIGWEAALGQARKWIAEIDAAQKPSGLSVDPVPTFELSLQGRPLRCLVRLSESLPRPPEGFETIGERAGLLLTVPQLSNVDEKLLTRLLASIPAGTSAGSPYLRFHDRANASVELVLPLEAN